MTRRAAAKASGRCRKAVLVARYVRVRRCCANGSLGGRFRELRYTRESGIRVAPARRVSLRLDRTRREIVATAPTVRRLPEAPEVLSLLCRKAALEPAEAYSTLNMGAGFAVYCSSGQGEEVVRLAGEHGLRAAVAGAVEQGPRRVVLEELEVTYESEALELTPPPEARAP